MRQLLINAGFCLLSLSIYAQKNTVATGGEATGTNGTVSYTVGQIDYSTSSGIDGNLNEGVQQPIEIFGNVGIQPLDWNVQIYPNPTYEYVILQMEQVPEQLQYALTDSKGSIVHQGVVSEKETELNLKACATGTYILQLTQNQEIISSSKIIKH